MGVRMKTACGAGFSPRRTLVRLAPHPPRRLVFYTEAKASDASTRQQPPRRAHCCSEAVTLATQGLRAEGNGVTVPLFPPRLRVARRVPRV